MLNRHAVGHALAEAGLLDHFVQRAGHARCVVRQDRRSRSAPAGSPSSSSRLASLRRKVARARSSCRPPFPGHGIHAAGPPRWRRRRADARGRLDMRSAPIRQSLEGPDMRRDGDPRSSSPWPTRHSWPIPPHVARHQRISAGLLGAAGAGVLDLAGRLPSGSSRWRRRCRHPRPSRRGVTTPWPSQYSAADQPTVRVVAAVARAIQA